MAHTVDSRRIQSRLLVALALAASIVRIAAAQGDVRLRGLVRDDAGTPVGRAEAYVLGEGAHTVADDSGRFVLPLRGSRAVTIRVRRIGYEVVDKQVILPDTGEASIVVTLQILAQSVATLHVVAKRAGLYGTVHAMSGRPLPGVEIQVLGAGTDHVITGASGDFDMPLKKSGTFFLLARKPGYAYVRTSLDFNADSGEEAVIVMSLAESDEESGYGRTEFILQESGTRVAMKSPTASVVSRDELQSRGAVPLSNALCGTRVTVNFPAARCPVALDPPGPPGLSRTTSGLNPCILINGDRRSSLPLNQFTADQVESVEFYPKRSDFSGTLGQRQCDNRQYDVFVVWLRKDP